MMFRLLPAAAMTATALAGMTAGAATVDVYGVVDTGLHYVKADSGDTSVTMDSGISKGSRVGLIGSEDLGGGYKIVFNLETGFSLDDGSFDNTKNRLVNPPRPIINLEFPPKCCYYTFERIFIGSSLGGLMPRSL